MKQSQQADRLAKPYRLILYQIYSSVSSLTKIEVGVFPFLDPLDQVLFFNKNKSCVVYDFSPSFGDYTWMRECTTQKSQKKNNNLGNFKNSNYQLIWQHDMISFKKKEICKKYHICGINKCINTCTCFEQVIAHLENRRHGSNVGLTSAKLAQYRPNIGSIPADTRRWTQCGFVANLQSATLDQP